MGTLTRNTTSVTDLNLSFEINSNTGDLNKLSNDTIIRRSIENLLTTAKTEKPFREDYGSDLKLNLFEVVSMSDLSMVKTQVKNIIDRGEPRVRLLDIHLKGDFDNNYIEITIKYMLKKNAKIDTFTTMLSLSE
tara:strand:+ start:126 stop:527 length:402 start_codon:yes stop_codon:yes gene_type:complete